MGKCFSRLIRKLWPEEIKFVMLGLPGAGKTTILHQLQLGEIMSSTPSVGFHVENVEYRELHIACWDVGTKFYDKVHSFTQGLKVNVKAVIFVVDSSDLAGENDKDCSASSASSSSSSSSPKLQLVKAELSRILADEQDLPGSMSVWDVSRSLRLDDIHDRPVGIVGCSSIVGDGLYEGIRFIYEQLHLKEDSIAASSSSSSDDNTSNINDNNNNNNNDDDDNDTNNDKTDNQNRISNNSTNNTNSSLSPSSLSSSLSSMDTSSASSSDSQRDLSAPCTPSRKLLNSSGSLKHRHVGHHLFVSPSRSRSVSGASTSSSLSSSSSALSSSSSSSSESVSSSSSSSDSSSSSRSFRSSSTVCT